MLNGISPYAKVRDWKLQLEELNRNGNGEMRPLVSGDRIVSVPPAPKANLLGRIRGKSHKSNSKSDVEAIVADVQNLVDATREEGGVVASCSRRVSAVSPKNYANMNVAQLREELDRLLASSACQLLRTLETLDEYLAGTKSMEDFIAELHGRYMIYLSSAINENFSPIQSCERFIQSVDGWFEQLQNAGSADWGWVDAMKSGFSQLSADIRRESAGQRRDISPKLQQTAQLAVGDTLSAETVKGDIEKELAISRDAIEKMTIPDTYPNARQMLLDDLSIFRDQVSSELEMPGNGSFTETKLKEYRQRLQKMRETMYAAVRSPDKETVSHPGRIGLANLGMDCEPNSHALAYAHLGAYDYFLWRPVQVRPDPGERPYQDFSQQEMELADVKRRRDAKRSDWLKAGPQNQHDNERDPLFREYEALSELHDTISRQITGEREQHRQRDLVWQNMHYEYRLDIEKQQQQQWWRDLFGQLQSPPKKLRKASLHRLGEGDILRAEPFYEELVPEEYRLLFTELNPHNPATAEVFSKGESRAFLWGGDGHWRFLLKNSSGGIDLFDDTSVTRNRFRSVESMVSHFNKPSVYTERQLTLISDK